MAGKIEPTQTKLTFSATAANWNDKYIDSAQALSFVNRRTYHQGKKYFLESVKVYTHTAAAATAQVSITINTIPDTWVTANAWVKAKAAWREMQRKVLDDNPSVEGKWNQFLVFMDLAHYTGGSANTGPNLNVMPIDSGGNDVLKGEWDTSTFVRPQHEVDPATGEPLAADEFFGHMLGANSGSTAAGSSLNSGGIILAYEDTRARVVEAPEVPADMSTSWMTLLSDTGSQEPELADVIETEGDNPPYDINDFVGGDANWSLPVVAGVGFVNLYAPEATMDGFCVPLGLMKIKSEYSGVSAIESPLIMLELNYVKGFDKGVATLPMKQ